MWNGEEGAGCSSSSKGDESGSRKRGHDELDESITLQEVVEIDQHLEDDARALLGSANDSVCTYPEGYPPRQMIYACKTCTSSSELAAICYGCSIHCHDEHDVIELYTKRKVCCDCGNSKFKNRCTLFPEKEPLNARNQYNHNYAGLYCICDRPYPSTDFDDGGDMVQCIICEDWFHTEHLEWTAGIDDAECGELVCGICAAKVNFLRYYTDKHYEEMQEDAVCKLKALMRKCVLIEEGDVGDAQVDDKMCKEKREQLNDQQVHSEREHDSSISPEEAHQACTTGATEGTNKQTVLECYTQKEKDGSAEEEQDVKQRLVGLSHEHVQRSDEVRIDKTNILEEGPKETVDFAETNEMRKRGSESSGDFDGTHRERETNAEPASSKECPDEESSKADGNVGSARREESLQKTVQGLEKLKVLLFRSSTWRQRLCKCKECWSMYEEKGVAFLLDPDDTLDSYTKDRYSNRPSEEVENKRVIDSLINLAGRDGAIFLMQGYEKMKNKILEMLMKKSAENSTITKEDVAKAFRELREETKRPRLE